MVGPPEEKLQQKFRSHHLNIDLIPTFTLVSIRYLVVSSEGDRTSPLHVI